MIDVNDLTKISKDCSLTEFVGTTVLDTIGLVIPGIDASLLERMDLKKSYKSLGLISSRTGAAGQINAADEAVKSTNTEIVSIELPRDTKGWGGHGCFIIIGGDNVSDVRRAVEIALEYIEKYATPENCTSARQVTWNSPTPPMRTQPFTWRSMRPSEDPSASSAALPLPSAWSWQTWRSSLLRWKSSNT